MPAGDNPVYPDVVVSIRSVRDSLDRFHKDLEVQLKVIKEIQQRARTVIGALEYFLDDEVADEEDKNSPSKETIEGYVEGKVSDFCFSQFADSYDKYFDFDRLDEQTIRGYLSMDEGNRAHTGDAAERVGERNEQHTDSAEGNSRDETEGEDREEEIEE